MNSEIPYLLNNYLGLFLKTWWWLFLPLFLYFPAKSLYRWWINWEVWYKEQEWAVLEIIPPAEIEKPFRAMQDVFQALWAPLFDSPNWREKWCEGELENGPFWGSFEVISDEGNIHYYLRVPKGIARLAEAVIHAHYPDAEIVEVEDYTKGITPAILDNDYDLRGEDYYLARGDIYPIKTYSFFEIAPQETESKKRLDPFISLLESLAKLKKGERVWLQIVFSSISKDDIPWVDKGKEKIAEIVKRPKKEEPKTILGETLRTLLSFFSHTPFESEGKKEEPIIPPEMRLTPGEREIVQAIENKIAQNGFKTSIRGLYIYKKDVFVPLHSKIVRAYFSHFGTQNLNYITFLGRTRTKVHYWLRERRLTARKKSLLRKYIRRFPPLYPQRWGPGVSIMTPEELATIFHFPMSSSALPPGVPRIAAKKGGFPPGLPSE